MLEKVVAVLLLTFAAGARPAASQETRMPLKMFDGLPTVPVSVNGALPRWFFVDTGASVTTLSARLADELGLVTSAPFEVETTTGTVRASRGQVRSLRVGAVDLGGGEVVWQRLDRAGASKHVDGILGFDRLSRVNFLLDYQRHLLELDPGETLNATLRGERTPFVRSMGRPVVQAIVQVRNDPERSRRLVIDSGATTAVLLDRPQMTAAAVRLMTVAGSAAAQGSEMSVALGRTTVAQTQVVIVPPRDGATREDQGLLPASLFAWMYFDVARGEIVWRRAA